MVDVQSFRLLRAVLGIRQKTLADRAGIAVKTLMRVENRIGDTSDKTTRAIDDALVGILEERALRALGVTAADEQTPAGDEQAHRGESATFRAVVG